MHRFFEYAFVLFGGFVFLSMGCVEARTPYLDEITATGMADRRAVSQKEKNKDKSNVKKDSVISRDMRKKAPSPYSLNAQPGKKLNSARNVKSNSSSVKDKRAKSEKNKSTKSRDEDKENSQKSKSREESGETLGKLSLSPM